MLAVDFCETSLLLAGICNNVKQVKGLFLMLIVPSKMKSL